MKYFRDISGQRFGHLVAVRVCGKYKHGDNMWLLACDCGKETSAPLRHILSGDKKSCGCSTARDRGKSGLQRRRHGHSSDVRGGRRQSRTYRIWADMRKRCNDERAVSYPHYGGRGIRVCERWEKFENFLADMGEVQPGMSIEREDPNGNYCPENCSWIPRRHQNRNKRNSRFTEVDIGQIRYLYSTGQFRQVDIARAFNTHQADISAIVRGDVWADVDVTLQDPGVVGGFLQSGVA